MYQTKFLAPSCVVTCFTDTVISVMTICIWRSAGDKADVMLAMHGQVLTKQLEPQAY